MSEAHDMLQLLGSKPKPANMPMPCGPWLLPRFTPRPHHQKQKTSLYVTEKATQHQPVSNPSLTLPPKSSSFRSMEKLGIREEEPAAPAAAGRPAGGGLIAALRELLGGPAGGGLVAALRELFEHKDRCIQASAFFFACGGSVVLHGTVFNLEDNPEHVLAGYGLFTIGAALGFLTLSGSDRLGRAAARIEAVFRELFH